MIVRIPRPAPRHPVAFLLAVAACAAVLAFAGPRPAAAQNQSQIAVAAAKTCAIMGGTQKMDPNGLQLLLLLDDDMADANPVAIALYRQVLVQCPKTYLAYEQRKRAHNPFKPGTLTSGTQQLTSGSTALTRSQAAPADFALRCRGAGGMASADARTLVVSFARGRLPATVGLAAGHCSWLNRAVRPGEPARIVALLANADLARKIAANIDAGHTWTFWVFAAGPAFHATAVAIGTPLHKP